MASSEILNELQTTIKELQILYNTNLIILAGDFNAVRSESDTSNGKIIKYRTSDTLNFLIEELHLYDLAQLKGKLSHTWHRNGPQIQSSRIDYIFTSIHSNDYTFRQYPSILDHNTLEACIGKLEKNKNPNMKDFILQSDTFINLMQNEMNNLKLNIEEIGRAHV